MWKDGACESALSGNREKGCEVEERNCNKELVTKDRKKICLKTYDVLSVTVSGFLPDCLLLLRAVGSPASAVPRDGDTAEQAAHCHAGATLALLGGSSAGRVQGD